MLYDLDVAASTGDLASVQRLLNYGQSDVNVKYRGRTALHIAAEHGHAHVVQWLLENHAAANARDIYAQTALHLAAMAGRTLARTVNALPTVLSAKQPNVGPETRDRFRQVAELLAGSTEVDAVDSAGKTALHVAVESDRTDIAAVLLPRVSDVNARDQTSSTPLHKAVQHDSADMAVLLLSHGADANAQDRMGRTPLHLAGEIGREKIANALISANSNTSIADSDGHTPLSLALKNANSRMVDLLRSKGGREAAIRYQLIEWAKGYVRDFRQSPFFVGLVTLCMLTPAALLGCFLSQVIAERYFVNRVNTAIRKCEALGDAGIAVSGNIIVIDEASGNRLMMGNRDEVSACPSFPEIKPTTVFVVKATNLVHEGYYGYDYGYGYSDHDRAWSCDFKVYAVRWPSCKPLGTHTVPSDAPNAIIDPGTPPSEVWDVVGNLEDVVHWIKSVPRESSNPSISMLEAK